jgi:hypothetical protein
MKRALRSILEDVDLTKVSDGNVTTTVAAEPEFIVDGKSLVAGLLGALRAYQLWFHAAHNLTKGTGFAGDHVNLYGKIYVESAGSIDAAIEKAIGVFNDEGLGCPIEITQLALKVLKGWNSPTGLSGQDIAVSALEYSLEMVTLIDEIAKNLDALGELTYGFDDFLAGLASTHEDYVYLLRQRSKS